MRIFPHDIPQDSILENNGKRDHYHLSAGVSAVMASTFSGISAAFLAGKSAAGHNFQQVGFYLVFYRWFSVLYISPVW